jgi:hypothetical protein
MLLNELKFNLMVIGLRLVRPRSQTGYNSLLCPVIQRGKQNNIPICCRLEKWNDRHCPKRQSESSNAIFVNIQM